MKKKIQKEFVDTGFGFPIRLINVPMVKVRGVWTPRIDYDALARAVLRYLAEKPARLTGAEVRFIRQHFALTLQAFASRFTVTHAAVLKWEGAGGDSTAMGWATEKDIRLFVLEKLSAAPRAFSQLYKTLETPPAGKAAPLSLDGGKLAA